MALQSRFAAWFKNYCADGGSVRDFLYGQISDCSKEVQGFRTRFDYRNVSLVDLNAEAKEWTAEAQDVREDLFFDSQLEIEREAYEHYIGMDFYPGCDLYPSQFDEIQTKLERGQLLPA